MNTHGLILILTLTTFQCMIQSCHGFASMFVEKTSSCWVDLRDTQTEIIMNNHILSPDDSPHGNDVSIELYDKTTNKQIDIEKVNGKNIVYIEDFRGSGYGDDEQVTLPFLLKLKVEDHPDLRDLQYVMDAKILPELDEAEQESDSSKNKSRMKAEFTHSKGCENMRANGRKGDKGLTLNIAIPASIFTLSDVHEQAVDVVAGWACGHEAVTLTESIQFKLKVNEGNRSENNSSGNGDVAVAVEERLEEESFDKKAEVDATRRREETEQLEIIVEEVEKEINEISRNRNIRRRNHNHHRRDELLEHIHEAKEKLHKLNKFYDKTGLGKASFSNHRYITGLFVIVVFGVVLLKFCMFKGKKSKGRRAL